MKQLNIRQLVRKNILELQPYISFRDHNEFNAPVLMDANECPFGRFNRYPDSTQKKLKAKIAAIKDVSPNQIAIGNGSDELIDLIIKIFCEPKKDGIVMMNPSFAMYAFYAAINENKINYLNLSQNFEINKNDFLEIADDSSLKVFFLCSPNNPTGNCIEDIEFYLENFRGIVVIDEAYIEFSGKESSIGLLRKYPNLIVLQTFSKAWGKAGARVGMAFASEEIIRVINTVKAPYNVNSISQELILECIDNIDDLDRNVESILLERTRLENELKKIPSVSKVFPTDANFFLVAFDNEEKVYQELLKNEILTSKRAPGIPNCIRINIGTNEENNRLINILQNIQ